MNRDLLLPAEPRRGGRHAGGRATASWALLAAGPAQAQAAPDAGTAMATAVALLSLTLAIGLAAWAWRTHRRARDDAQALQQCRAEAHAQRGVLDVWQWRSDAGHRLVAWCPAAGSTSAVASPRLGAPLWDVFSGGEASGMSLQSQLEQHMPLAGLRAALPPKGSAPPVSCVLRGQPVLDAQGRFAGHVGTARATDDAVSVLLTEVLQALPTPVFQVALPGRGQALQLVRHNRAGRAWLGESNPANDPTWDHLLAGMPADLRGPFQAAIEHPVEAPVDLPGGWRLQLHRVPCVSPETAPGHVIAVLQRPDAGGPHADPLAEDAESFSYTVSHDLRAPIRVVEGFTKIVKEDYGRALDRIGNDHLDRVLAAAARMNSMIDSLLALSQLSSRPLSRQPVNLSLIASYIIEDLRRQAPEREVEVVIESGLQVHGDATLLRVVLENLLGNAWKYTGRCRVGRIWFEASEHEGRRAFTVRDNGAGFDMRFADRLFGVFQRLHSANDFQGTGVGLASVRRILRRHGGDIWAEAEVDRGARFHFWM